MNNFSSHILQSEIQHLIPASAVFLALFSLFLTFFETFRFSFFSRYTEIEFLASWVTTEADLLPLALHINPAALVVHATWFFGLFFCFGASHASLDTFELFRSPFSCLHRAPTLRNNPISGFSLGRLIVAQSSACVATTWVSVIARITSMTFDSWELFSLHGFTKKFSLLPLSLLRIDFLSGSFAHFVSSFYRTTISTDTKRCYHFPTRFQSRARRWIHAHWRADWKGEGKSLKKEQKAGIPCQLDKQKAICYR